MLVQVAASINHIVRLNPTCFRYSFAISNSKGEAAIFQIICDTYIVNINSDINSMNRKVVKYLNALEER